MKYIKIVSFSAQRNVCRRRAQTDSLVSSCYTPQTLRRQNQNGTERNGSNPKTQQRNKKRKKEKRKTHSGTQSQSDRLVTLF